MIEHVDYAESPQAQRLAELLAAAELRVREARRLLNAHRPWLLILAAIGSAEKELERAAHAAVCACGDPNLGASPGELEDELLVLFEPLVRMSSAERSQPSPTD